MESTDFHDLTGTRGQFGPFQLTLAPQEDRVRCDEVDRDTFPAEPTRATSSDPRSRWNDDRHPCLK